MLKKILLGTLLTSFNFVFADPSSVLDRNYTLADAGKNFLDSIRNIPSFLLILAAAIGVIFFVHAGLMLIKYGRNHQIRGSSIITRLIVSGLLWAIPLVIIWVLYLHQMEIQDGLKPQLENLFSQHQELL